jgi:hypothetical protein
MPPFPSPARRARFSCSGGSPQKRIDTEKTTCQRSLLIFLKREITMFWKRTIVSSLVFIGWVL